uniref:PHD finger protein 3 n=1 Tax=Aceria tosichella TaxID=561515 RepID=A0A6G1SPS6_9ACAR
METRMLDQENETRVEQSTTINPNNAINNNNNFVINNNKVSSTVGNNNNPLSDHDYCSPRFNKGEVKQVSSVPSKAIVNVREKRQRKEVHDPVFSQFTSSEYSSSDVESDREDSDADSVDDPNRPWCTCEKPDDGNFMIECEICKYWFHGRCVGMTQSLSKQREKEGKEWFCSNCDHALQSGTPRDAIPPRLVKKEKKKKKLVVKTMKRRGRPRKSESAVSEVTPRTSLRSTRRATSSFESNSFSNGKSDTRSQSFEKFDDGQRLRQLIREKKKDFFLKYRLNKRLTADKIKEKGLSRHSLTAPLGHSLDTLASNTSSPNMNNLPINIKSELKDRSKPNIVLQINTKKDIGHETVGSLASNASSQNTNNLPINIKSEFKDRNKPNIVLQINTKKDIGHETLNSSASNTSSPNMNNLPINIKSELKDRSKPNIVLQINTKKDVGNETSGQRIVTAIVKKRKTSESCDSDANELFTADPIHSNKKSNSQADTVTTTTPSTAQLVTAQQVIDEKIHKVEEMITSSDPSPKRISNESEPNNIDDQCWSGTITMSEVGRFSARARPVSGDVNFMRNEISQTLMVCGRIAPDQVTSYLKKLKSTTKNQIFLVQLYPLTENDKASFNLFYDYLYTRNRCGVITANGTSLKDFYIQPLHQGASIPEVLKPINGPGLDKKEPNCLLGLLVKPTRPVSA